MPGGIHPPPHMISSWPEPDFVNPSKHTNATVAILAVFGTLVFLTVFARSWARTVIQHKCGLDDGLILVSLLPTLALTIGVGIANERLFNRHVWDYKPHELVAQRKITWANEFNYVLSSGLIKTSVLLFYRRMAFERISRTFRITTIVSLASVVLFTFAFLLAIFFSCQPLHAFWNQLNRDKIRTGLTYKCYDESAHLLAATIIATVQDFIATSLPALLCWRLQISAYQKIALYACFGVGYAITVISAVRCYYIWYIFHRTYDVPWYTWYLWILTWLEIAMGTICASIPASKVFFRHVHVKVSQSDSIGSTVLRIRRGRVLDEMVCKDTSQISESA